MAKGYQGAESSRFVVFGNFNYDVSLCDLVHSKLDFVFYPQLNQVSWRQRNHAVWNSVIETVLLCLIVLFLFTRVCHNLTNMIQGTTRVFDWYTFSTMLVVVCASFDACRHNYFVAEEKWLTLCLQERSPCRLTRIHQRSRSRTARTVVIGEEFFPFLLRKLRVMITENFKKKSRSITFFFIYL